MTKPQIDYGVYLVTDSTAAVLGDRSLAHVVEEALRGGVTCVQYRDKTSDRGIAVQTAKTLHKITKRFHVPLLINDRVDVAAEVGCEGVHIGQDDMAFQQAREILGPEKIIGVTASSKEEAIRACEAGADYLGIGTVYSTPTKKDTKSIIGTAGVRDILAALTAANHGDVPCVCIGGVNGPNAGQVLSQCASPRKSLDGVAVVSAIVAAPDPAQAARNLSAVVTRGRIPDIMRAVVDKTPLSHNMTNLVVQNFAANVGLAVGASPIMANYAEEAADLAKLGGSLVINMGTVTPEGLKNYLQALKAYNDARRPVILDPVGAGATAVRRSAVKTLLSAGNFAIIKGNEREIQTVYNSIAPTTTPQHQDQQQRGVDSSSTLTLAQKAHLARSLSLQAGGSVVVLTGATDVISDGRRTFRVDNGHPLLGMVTGTGCTLGTVISSMAAAWSSSSSSSLSSGRLADAAVAGAVMFGVAAEMAAGRSDVKGPGTFVPAFIDELYGLRKATAEGDMRWTAMVKLEAIAVEGQDA